MTKAVDTKTQIIEAALALLVNSGIEGLTMRKVANETGRSLSNVQHHFKNKQILLCAIVEYYFSWCTNVFDEFEKFSQSTGKRGNYEFFLFCLAHMHEHEDMCLFFREIWAYALRDDEIQTLLVGYQRQALEQLQTFWADYPSANVEQAAALVLPYFDGYSLYSRAIDMKPHALARMMADLVDALLQG